MNAQMLTQMTLRVCERLFALFSSFQDPIWYFAVHICCSVGCKDRVLQVLATCCYSLQRAITLLDSSGILLDEDTAHEASKMLCLHVKSYVWLAVYFFKKHQLLFRIRPKHHYLLHKAVQIRTWKINMKVFSTWDEEAFLGKIKAIACACHGKTLTQRLYERYILVLALTLNWHGQLNS